MSPTIISSKSEVLTVCCLLVFVKATHNMPLKNNFNGSENPTSAKVTNEKSYGMLFSRIMQEFKHLAPNEILSPSVIPQDLVIGESECIDQIAKLLIIPFKVTNEISKSKLWDGTSFIPIPIHNLFIADFKEYKVVVAVAPETVRVGRGDKNKPTIVYVVFHDDDVSKPFEIPEIYFVIKNKNTEPIIVMDSNRTVTGIKTVNVTKIVKLRNKLTSAFDYR